MSKQQNWQRVQFGSVVRQVKEKVDLETSGLTRYVAGQHMETDDLRIRSWGEINDDYLGPAFHMRFKPGQVLYGSRRTYLRKVAVPHFEGICANTTFVLESKNPNVLLPELLPFIMQTEAFHAHSIKQSKGSVNPYINFSDIAWYEFALPPLEEQRRIASLLWSLEALITEYKASISVVHQAATSMMLSALAKFDDQEHQIRVEKLLEESPKNGYSPRTNDSGNGLRTVSISSIVNGSFEPDGNIKYADVSIERVSQYFVQEKDVFVVRGNGNMYLTGKCGIAISSYTDLFYPDLLIRLRFDSELIEPEFAALQWNTPNIHRNLISRAKSTNGIWKINGQDVRNHKLILPPLAEQHRLLADIKTVHSSANQMVERMSSTIALKSSLLSGYLGGKQ